MSLVNGKMFSIIIPVYNAENSIKKAIDSILSQTVSNYEIILVDDGSTDSSGKLCDAYAEEYSNVKVTHKVNGGISSARNAGIASAEGEYILFCDADDFFEKDALEKIARVIDQYSPDCICFDWQYVTAEGQQPPATTSLPQERLLNKAFIHQTILPPLLNLSEKGSAFVYDYSVNKVYKKSILVTNGIHFDENRRIWEDRPFVVEYLKYCNSFYYLPCALYNYVQVNGSLSSQYYNELFDDIISNHRLYAKLYGDEYDFETQYANNYWCHSIENMIRRALKEPDAEGTIRAKIEETLGNKQVIAWYKKREPASQLEKKASSYVIAGKTTEAIQMYQRVNEIEGKHQRIAAVKTRAKSAIKRLIMR